MNLSPDYRSSKPLITDIPDNTDLPDPLKFEVLSRIITFPIVLANKNYEPAIKNRAPLALADDKLLLGECDFQNGLRLSNRMTARPLLSGPNYWESNISGLAKIELTDQSNNPTIFLFVNL